MKPSDNNDRFCIQGARYDQRRTDRANDFCLACLSLAAVVLLAAAVIAAVRWLW